VLGALEGVFEGEPFIPAIPGWIVTLMQKSSCCMVAGME
jgi:hypothetical protein